MNNEPYRHFHDELATLKERVLHMSGQTQHALSQAMEAFLFRKRDVAAAVITADHDIDELELEIDAMVTSLLARYQPVAKDLRLILAALKISNDLERVGDHAVNIAKTVERLLESRPFPPEPGIVEMSRRARDMLATALDAFVKGDAQAGRGVCVQDDELDDLNRSMFQLILPRMAKNPDTLNPAMQFLNVSRNLERVGDLATNIAEEVVFLVEGTSIKHHAEERS